MSYSPEQIENVARSLDGLSRQMLRAYAATIRQQGAQPDDSRCPPTYRREEAVKVLIGMGWSWDGKQWNAPVQQAARVDGEYASDLRHLIYLDTQFGWRGETDLKLHEMQALEARGWIAQGEENSEYAITEEGERLINAALSAQQAARVDDGMVSEGLDYFEKSGDDGDRLYVQAIREKIAALEAALSAQPAAHPDDTAVDAFAEAMKAKLAEARAKGRGGWQDKDDCPQQRLSDMLRAHVEKGDPRDVANFCMFLHQRGEAILPARRAERQGEAVKRWPFVESPGEFTERLREAMQHFPLIGAVRHVLIENPPEIDTHPAAPVGVPDGMVLVPKKASNAMLDAGMARRCEVENPGGYCSVDQIYKAMLAAAPSAPQGVE